MTDRLDDVDKALAAHLQSGVTPPRTDAQFVAGVRTQLARRRSPAPWLALAGAACAVGLFAIAPGDAPPPGPASAGASAQDIWARSAPVLDDDGWTDDDDDDDDDADDTLSEDALAVLDDDDLPGPDIGLSDADAYLEEEPTETLLALAAVLDQNTPRSTP